MYQNERAEERAVRTADDERVEPAAASEAERRAADAEREIEREVRAADALERERDKAREHEIRVLELTNYKGNFDQSMADAAMRPKLPVFKDGDDIVSSIIRFERIAVLLKLTPESYAVRMGSLSLLSGKALKIYAALSPETTDDYNSLKAALLSGFNKTPESYRGEF